MNEHNVAAATAKLIDADEALIAGLLEQGINTWEKVEEYGLDPDPEGGHFRRLWEMRVAE